MRANDSAVDPKSCCVERRDDGAILVRVPSRNIGATPLPDAVFSFRAGDPQFAFWQHLFQAQHATG
jgi:hypothetical protein